MIENADRETSDGKKFNSEKMLRSSVNPKSSTATIVSLTERETVNSPTTKSRTMKPGSEKSDSEKSVSKNLFSKMSGRKNARKRKSDHQNFSGVYFYKKKSTAKG